MFYRQRVRRTTEKHSPLLLFLHIVRVPKENPQKTFILDPTFCLLVFTLLQPAVI